MSKNEQVAIPKDIEKLSFEEALAELEGIVGKLESGAAKLEESIDFYTRGTQLKAHCQNKLRDAQSKVEKLVVNASGDLGTEPLDVE